MQNPGTVVAACVVAAGLWAAGAGVAQTSGKPKEPTKAEKLAGEAKALAAELKEARELVKKLPEGAARDKLELQISRAELRAQSLQQDLDGLAKAPPPARVAMADADFQKLLKAFKTESFDSGKGEVLATVKGVSLNCEQLKAILKVYSGDDGRVAAAVHFHPMLVDPEKVFDLADTFTFDSGRRAFREAMGKLNK